MCLPERTYLHSILINLTTSEKSEPTTLTAGFHDMMDLDEFQIVSSDTLFFSLKDDWETDNLQYIETLYALITAKEVDIMLMSISDFEILSSMEIFGNLEELLPEDLWLQIKDDAIYMFDSESNLEFPAALDVTNESLIQDCNFISDSVVVCIIPNTLRLDNCINMIQYIYSH